MYIYMYIYRYTYMHMCLYMCVCARMCVYMCKYTCVHVYLWPAPLRWVCSSRTRTRQRTQWRWNPERIWLYLDAEIVVLPPVFLPQNSVFVGRDPSSPANKQPSATGERLRIDFGANMLNTRNEEKNTVFYSYSACFVNIGTLNMYVSMSYTGLTRRNTVFRFLWLRHRNTWISIQRVGFGAIQLQTCQGAHASRMNKAHLSHLPFWGPSEAIFFLIKRPSG